MTSTTKQRIVEAALRRFNTKGYDASTLTEIARDLGISQGNLTYHYPTKLDIAFELSETVRLIMEERRSKLEPGDIAHDYVEHLRFGKEMGWRFRFLMRDQGIWDDGDERLPPSPILLAHMADLRRLVTRVDDEGLFRSDAAIDVDVFSRSLWILSRHWTDYLREVEQADEFEWAHVERGIEHHFAVLLPALKPSARTRFNDALAAARSRTQSDVEGDEGEAASSGLVGT